MVKEYELLAEQATVFTRSDRRRFRPWGIAGGAEGAPSDILLRRAGAEGWLQLPVFSVTELRRGDRLRLATAGGGGYGAPS